MRSPEVLGVRGFVRVGRAALGPGLFATRPSPSRRLAPDRPICHAEGRMHGSAVSCSKQNIANQRRRSGAKGGEGDGGLFAGQARCNGQSVVSISAGANPSLHFLFSLYL